MRSGFSFSESVCWAGLDRQHAEVSLYEVDLTPTPEQLISSYPYRYVYLTRTARICLATAAILTSGLNLSKTIQWRAKITF